ncbi:MAG TPA: hypothetical protein VIK16_00860, partial [Candidatus Limnocylindrales bacterium]
EPFWRLDPEPAYLEGNGMGREEFGTHAGNVQAGVTVGLVPLYALASSEDDFDRYESLQWRRRPVCPRAPRRPGRAGAARTGRPWPPRVPDLGRVTLGWSLYLFRR